MLDELIGKTIWTKEALGKTDDICHFNNINFSYIKNQTVLRCFQMFLVEKTQSVSFGSLYSNNCVFHNFITWLNTNHSNTSFMDITRLIIEEYLVYLNTCGKYSDISIYSQVRFLSSFFNWGYIDEIDGMPQRLLFIDSDASYKQYKRSRYLTDSEVKGFLSVLNKIPQPYRKMAYILLLTGCRFSEIAFLKIDALHQTENSSYYLDIMQYKTKTVITKPIPDTVAKIIENEISRNKKKHGDKLQYVFVNNNNKPIVSNDFNKAINKTLAENNIKGRDGKTLHITSHQFRATVATGLASKGVDPYEAAKILGQKSLTAYSHYATVKSDIVKEELKFRIDKDNYLISHINDIVEPEKIPKSVTPLCNGYCGRNALLGGCAKANECFKCSMFIPSQKLLFMYKSQLSDLEINAQLAEEENMMALHKKLCADIKALKTIIHKLEEKRRSD